MEADELSCSTTPWPTTAPDPLRVWGRVVNASNGHTPIMGALVEIRASDDSLLGQTTSGNDASFPGGYSMDLVTGGVAPTFYRKHTAPGFIDHYTNDAYAMFGAFPYQGDMQTVAARDAYYQQVGVVPDPGKGTLQVAFYNCELWPDQRTVSGVTVAPPPGSTAVYYDDELRLDPELLETSSSGMVLLMNVTPGTVDVTAHVGELTYRSWPVTVRAGVWTESVRDP